MIKFVEKQVQREPGSKPSQPLGSGGGYRPDYVDRVRGYCLLGATNKEICRFLHTTEMSLNNWIAKYPEFREAIREGREADHRVARSLFQRAVGYNITTTRREIVQSKGQTTERVTITEEHIPADVHSAWMWMKLRCGWVDRNDKDNLTADDLIQFAQMARAEAARRGIDIATAIRETPRSVLPGRGLSIDDEPAGNGD